MGRVSETKAVAGRAVRCRARLWRPWALPLGCRSHCHSNYSRADSSCTSLKLIASHSIHFTNMCGNYYFARVIKWESIRNERDKTANIPGIIAPTLIMTENLPNLAKFGKIVSRRSHLKRGDRLDWCWQLWTLQTSMLIHKNQQKHISNMGAFFALVWGPTLSGFYKKHLRSRSWICSSWSTPRRASCNKFCKQHSHLLHTCTPVVFVCSATVLLTQQQSTDACGAVFLLAEAIWQYM